MDISWLIHAALLGTALGGVFYWAFIGPARAQRRRRAALGECGGRGAAWDRRVY